MPYVSDQQRKWAHTEKGMKALGGLAKVKEWDRESKGMNLIKSKTVIKNIKNKQWHR